MEKEKMIPAVEFCNSHNIELSVIHSISSFGLIDFVIIEEEMFVPNDKLPVLEKLLRLNIDLGINLEGIETIMHLLDRLEEMQQQLAMLHNKLSFYEAG